MLNKDTIQTQFIGNKKLMQAKERYHKLRENVEKKKPGRKPKINDKTPSTTAYDEEGKEEVKSITDKVKKILGRPRRVNFGSGNGIVI